MFTNCETSCLYVVFTCHLCHSFHTWNHSFFTYVEMILCHSFISQENDPIPTLSNTGTSVLHNLVDIQYEFVSVFRSNLDLVKCLWNHYRRHLKVEFSEIWAHGLRPLLQYSAEACTELNQKMSIEFATPTYLNRHPQRLRSDVLNLLTNWCEMPETVLDIFLNFDNDTKLVHCALFSDITAEIIELAAPSWLDDPTEVSLAMNESLLVRSVRAHVSVYYNFNFSCFNHLTQIRRISLVSLNHTARKSLEIRAQMHTQVLRKLNSRFALEHRYVLRRL